MDKYFNFNEKINGYSILKKIGEGRFGIAYLAINDKYEKCVIKQLKREMLDQSRDKMFYEETILRQLDSSRFPKFISTFKDDYREGYLLEYVEGQVFYDLLKRKGYQFSKDEIYSIGSQLLDIVELLHSKNIVHRDIRPPNVIWKDNKKIALIDFGLARFIDNKRYVKQNDYWFIGDFLIFLYYSNFKSRSPIERPWYKELDLNFEELKFLTRLMGMDHHFHNIEEVKIQFEKIKGKY